VKQNRVLGGVLAVISGLMGIIGHTIIFLKWYIPGMQAEAAEPGCEILLKFIHPAMSDLGMLAGVIFLVSAYGFFTKKNWAFLLSVIAIVLALQGSWFINVPFMAAGLPPVYFILFWPYLVSWVTSGLLHPVLALPGNFLPDHGSCWEDILGKNSTGFSAGNGLGVLPYEWDCQPE